MPKESFPKLGDQTFNRETDYGRRTVRTGGYDPTSPYICDTAGAGSGERALNNHFKLSLKFNFRVSEILFLGSKFENFKYFIIKALGYINIICVPGSTLRRLR